MPIASTTKLMTAYLALKELPLDKVVRAAPYSAIPGESLLGLANLVCDLGPTRLGVCAAAPCRRVFVDTSPNRSRRYCSDPCPSRANVAAYRARQRAVTPA